MNNTFECLLCGRVFPKEDMSMVQDYYCQECNSALSWEDPEDLVTNYHQLDCPVYLLDLIKRLVTKLPAEVSSSGVGSCTGCGAYTWVSGDPSYKEECKPDCVRQEALAVIDDNRLK